MTRIRNKKAFQFLMVLLLIGFVASCSTAPNANQPAPIQTAYNTIKSAAIAYDAVMSALGDLDRQGKITLNQKAIVLNYGGKFWRAYHTAVDALYTYKQVGGDGLSLDSALGTLTAALAGFLEYSAEITK